jgi:MoxR-like ATPase
MSDPGALYDAIRGEVQTVLIGNEDIIEGLTVALLSDGHVLLEGVPGIAKTTAAALFARASGLEHTRIQMTPDVLPADITGTQVYREATGAFVTRKGPIFSNVVLADEINRATPKTQSALLEAMAERNVTIEGESHELPSPFLLVATQNPIEMEGTFALPEAQRDRFQQKLTMGLPNRENERDLLDRFDETPSLGTTSVEQVVEPDDILAARDVVDGVYVDGAVKKYVLELVGATRDHDSVEHGASPRASLAFLQAGKARAAIHNREYVIPDDVKALAESILVHRLVLQTDAEIGGTSPEDIVADILTSVNAPSGADYDGPVPTDSDEAGIPEAEQKTAPDGGTGDSG